MTTATAGLVVVCLLWAGMVGGISFLEAPVKFRAPSLTRTVGLEVGRHVFGALGHVEIGAALLTAALAAGATVGPAWRWGLLALVWSLVLAQRLWLWPVLSERARRIAAGESPSSSYHHALFIGSEAVKVLLLIGVSATLLFGA